MIPVSGALLNQALQLQAVRAGASLHDGESTSGKNPHCCNQFLTPIESKGAFL